MSVKRVYYVKSARVRYARESTGERVEVKGRRGRGGGQMTRRVTKADHSRPLPNYKCGKCGDEILPGMPYRFWEPHFRSSYKAIRCMKSTCTPRMSELESSLIAEVYSARESVEDQLQDLTSAEDASFFEALRDEISEAYDSVITQYQEADEAMGGSQATQAYEQAEELEGQKDEIDNLDFEDAPERSDIDACEKAGTDEPDGHTEEENTEGCEACDVIYEEAVDNWRNEQAETLNDALSNL